jgi:hypothetical protein
LFSYIAVRFPDSAGNIGDMIERLVSEAGVALNRAALVGCNNEKLSQDYANQLYTRKYLRDASVTGRLGDMHINKDGSKTMEL